MACEGVGGRDGGSGDARPRAGSVVDRTPFYSEARLEHFFYYSPS